MCVMPKKKYIVSLTAQEREYLEKLTTTGKTATYKINHARVLLKADINQDGGGSLDQVIANALDISVSSYLAPGNLNVNSLTKCQISQVLNVL